MACATCFQSDSQIKVIAEAKDGVEALHMVRTLRPDILLLDLAMPKMPGMEALREMTADGGTTRTIVLTGQVEKRQMLELQLGARGVVLKDAKWPIFGLHSRRDAGSISAQRTPGAESGAGAARPRGPDRAAAAQDLRPHLARAGSSHLIPKAGPTSISPRPLASAKKP